MSQTPFQRAIQRETTKLKPETHPQTCQLRDTNYNRLEELITLETLDPKYTEPPSIQTAIAALETGLSEVNE